MSVRGVLYLREVFDGEGRLRWFSHDICRGEVYSISFFHHIVQKGEGRLTRISVRGRFELY